MVKDPVCRMEIDPKTAIENQITREKPISFIQNLFYFSLVEFLSDKHMIYL